MAKKAIDEVNYEIIKAHILSPTPEDSPLPPEKQELMNRWIAMSKLIDLYPVQKNCVKLHRGKNEHLSESAAINDFRMAQKLFNSMHTFDYDFWHSWLINDIIRMIKRSRDAGDFKAWGIGHTNLLKAIGDRPLEVIDPEILTNHNYFTVINIDNKPMKMTLEEMHNLPIETRTAMVKQLEKPIDESMAIELMNT